MQKLRIFVLACVCVFGAALLSACCCNQDPCNQCNSCNKCNTCDPCDPCGAGGAAAPAAAPAKAGCGKACG